MASLNPQTLFSPGNDIYMLKNGAYFQGSFNISASGQPNEDTMNLNMANNVGTLRVYDAAIPPNNDTQLNIQADTGIYFNISQALANKNVADFLQTAIVLRQPLFIEMGPLKDTIEIYNEVTDAYLTKCGIIVNEPSSAGTTPTSIKFGSFGIIQTTDKLQVGSSSQASVTVGTPAGNNVLAGPDRFAFQTGTTASGGLYQQGSSIILGQGASPATTGAGVTVGPTTVGFRKSIEAQANAISINAQGAVRSVASATNVGGLIQVANGNYYTNLQANGDGFIPNGTGGSLISYNAGTATVAPTTYVPGQGTSIVGPSNGVMNVEATNNINLLIPPTNPASAIGITANAVNITGNNTIAISAPESNPSSGIGLTATTISINAASAINMNATGTSADITLNAVDSINFNAPRVLINGGLITPPTFYYQWNGAEQAIDGNPNLGDGSFLGWDTTLYQSPGYGNRFAPGDITFWICPVPGIYHVTVNLLCNLQNATAGMSIDLLRFPASGGIARVGTQMRPAGYQPTSSSPPSNLPFYQSAAGVICGTFYTQLVTNDRLMMCGGTFDPGGFLYVQPNSTWSIQYVAAQ